MGKTILVVDDHLSFCHHIRAILVNHGYEVDISVSPLEALEMLRQHPFDVLLTDMRLPDLDGVSLFREAKKLDQHLSGIIMTAYGTIPSAVTAIKEGISDYLQKPFEPEALLLVMEKIFKEREVLRELYSLRREVDIKYGFDNIIGKNPRMQAIFELIKKVAPTESRVLITGETGTGKELIAKAIHYHSNRKAKPFVGINCCALTDTLLESELFGYEKGAFTGAYKTKPGKFEYVDGGTLFLDEIGDIAPAVQVKLLRVLQEKKFERVGGNKSITIDVRIIAATNQDLKQKIADNEFRLDLFYRLNVVHIHLPPLRRRKEDIPLLVNHFLAKLEKSLHKEIARVSPQAMSQLLQYSWPGNVRELENVLERSCVVCDGNVLDKIVFFDEHPPNHERSGLGPLHTDLPFPLARQYFLERFEGEYIASVLKKAGGSVAEAAKQAHIPVRTLWRKIKDYKINPKTYRN